MGIAGVCFILVDVVNATIHLVSLIIGGIVGVASFGVAATGSIAVEPRAPRAPSRCDFDERGITVTQSLFG
jgi:hypothetical protein